MPSGVIRIRQDHESKQFGAELYVDNDKEPTAVTLAVFPTAEAALEYMRALFPRARPAQGDDEAT